MEISRLRFDVLVCLGKGYGTFLPAVDCSPSSVVRSLVWRDGGFLDCNPSRDLGLFEMAVWILISGRVGLG